MRIETKAKISSFNEEYNNINTELKKYEMKLVAHGIFKGEYPHSEYMGNIKNYKDIIQAEKQSLSIDINQIK